MSGKGAAKVHHFCIYVDKNEIIDESILFEAPPDSDRQRAGDIGRSRQSVDKAFSIPMAIGSRSPATRISSNSTTENDANREIMIQR